MKCAKGENREIRNITRDSKKWREFRLRIGGKVNERDEWKVNDG